MVIVFSIITKVMNHSKASDFTNPWIAYRQGYFSLSGSTASTGGLTSAINLWILTHSFYSSSRPALPSVLIFYSLNWRTITEMNRFMTKKVVMKMKEMYNTAIIGFASFSMIPSTSGA